MSEEANLEAYLKRINYAGSIAPVLETLELLHQLHPAAIPFENLDPLMDMPVRLQLSDLEQKLIIERRGGYCFEHNLLFKAVLETMDFRVTPVAAGVLWGHPDGHVPEAPSHMALIVDVGGIDYLADVGFGGPGLMAPLRLRADAGQATPHGTYRLSGGHPKWQLDMQVGEDWKPLYEFTEAAQEFEQYVAMNDVAMLRFRDDLVAARIDGSRRQALFNNRLSTHADGGTETRVLTTLLEIRDVLTTVFGIHLPQTDRLDPALEKALRPMVAD